MKKLKLLILFTLLSTLGFSQTVREYWVTATIKLSTDSMLVFKTPQGTYDTLMLSNTANGQILRRVSGQWINIEPSFLDSLLKSENVLFTNPSNDSVVSQLAIKTFILQSISDSLDVIETDIETKLDTALKSEDGLFNTPSNDSVVSQLAAYTFILQTARDSALIVRDSLDDILDVSISTAIADDLLGFDGINWIPIDGITVSGSSGVEFYMNDTEIIGTGTNNDNKINTLLKTPHVGAEDADTISCANNTVMYGSYLYDTDLGGTTIDGGVWTFNTYAAVNSVNGGRVSSILRNIFIVEVGAGTGTVTGSGTSRTFTASGGTPFASGDANADQTLAGFVLTPLGLYQITGYTNTTTVTITTPTTYSNESGVAFSVYKYQLGSNSGTITAISTSFTLHLKHSVQAEISINATDKLAEIVFGISNNTTLVIFTHDGTEHYSHFETPLTTRHDDLAGLKLASSGETYGHIDDQAQTIAGAKNFSSAVTSTNFISNVAIGTQPYAATSTTKNTNLNADLLDGIDTTQLALLATKNTFAEDIIFQDSLRVDGNSFFKDTISTVSADSSNLVFQTLVTAEDSSRFRIYANGEMRWGDGTLTPDLRLEIIDDDKIKRLQLTRNTSDAMPAFYVKNKDLTPNTGRSIAGFYMEVPDGVGGFRNMNLHAYGENFLTASFRGFLNLTNDAFDGAGVIIRSHSDDGKISFILGLNGGFLEERVYIDTLNMVSNIPVHIQSALTVDDDITKEGTSVINTAELQNSLVGAYYRFSTDDYIEIADNIDLDVGTDDFSQTIVFKPNTVSGTQYLINKEAGGVGYGIYLIDDDIYIRFDDNNADASAIILIAQFVADKWYSLSVSFDRSGNATAILNGTISGTVDISGTNLTLDNTGAYRVGSTTAGASFFDGYIGLNLHWNRALTTAEMLDISQWKSNNPPISFVDVGANQDVVSLANNGFETGISTPPANWTNQGNQVGSSVADGTAPEGSNVMEIVASGAGSSSNRIYGTNILTEGIRYRQTFYAKSISGNTVLHSQHTANVTDGVTITGSWVKYSVEFIAFSALRGAYFYLEGAGTCRVDDIILTQIGNILNLNESGIGHNTWMGNSGNDLFGTVSGAIYTNIPSSDNEKVRQDGVSTDTQILTSSNIIPDGYILKYAIGTETNASTGTIDGGSTAGTSNVFSQGVFTASVTTVVECNFPNLTGTDLPLYINDDGAGTWNGSSINFVFILQKIR